MFCGGNRRPPVFPPAPIPLGEKACHKPNRPVAPPCRFLVETPLSLSNALPVLVARQTGPVVILRGSGTRRKIFSCRVNSASEKTNAARAISSAAFSAVSVQSKKWITSLDLIASLPLLEIPTGPPAATRHKQTRLRHNLGNGFGANYTTLI